jgi:hypothetical protein
MAIEKPDYTLPDGFKQLTFDLELEEVEGNGVSEQERMLRSETARQALEVKTLYEIPWLEDYLRLREGGWPWRQSAFIAWSSQPIAKRKPRKQDDFARMIGLTSDRAFSTWRRRNPAIDEMIMVLQSAPLFDHRADIFRAMIDSATTEGYKGHNDRKLSLEILGDYVPSSKLAAVLTRKLGAGNMSEISEEDLDKALALVMRQAEKQDGDAGKS